MRQLQNLVERLVVLSSGPVIGAADVSAALGGQVRFVTQTASPEAETAAEGAPDGGTKRLDDAVRDAERAALEEALAKAGGNRTEAARILGISRRTLYTKLQALGID